MRAAPALGALADLPGLRLPLTVSALACLATWRRWEALEAALRGAG